jgi:3'-5' exoribonuclease
VGKIRELQRERSFEYTDEGRLLGHIVMGASLLTGWADQAGLSGEVTLKLTHMILSHHGSYEFGSPKRPKFLEALILNYLDELDSKVKTFSEIAAREAGQKWSSYQKLFDRYIYLGEPGSPPADAPRREDELTHKPFRELDDQGRKPGEALDLFTRSGRGDKES